MDELLKSELPRCDKCNDCEHAQSKKYEGYTYWCKLKGRDVGQSHFGQNSPGGCPKRKLNKENRVMSINKLYLLTKDYRIVYIDHMCTCDKCRERGETEIFIHGLDGSYADCLKLHELNTNFEKWGILTVGSSVDEIIRWIKDFVIDKKEKENRYYQELNKLLNQQIRFIKFSVDKVAATINEIQKGNRRILIDKMEGGSK